MTGFKVKFDGQITTFKSPKQFLAAVLEYVIDEKYSSLEAMKENSIEVFVFVSEVCESLKKEEVKGFDKRELSRMSNVLNSQIPYWKRIDSREKFLSKLYDLTLSLEGLGTLLGFGFTNRFGDSLRGNPERNTIC